MQYRKSTSERRFSGYIESFRQQTLTRRRFLLGMAGGSLATLMPLSLPAQDEQAAKPDHWAILERVQDHLFPSEVTAPGARELNALDYLKWVVTDKGIDEEERLFILRGVNWLEDLSLQQHQVGFLKLPAEQQDKLLRQVARSDAGENWIATLLIYLLEALLSAPVYGGNPDQVGWRWLGHQPGFPLPDTSNRYRGI
jgi:gluconate 2-dehydrogenase gamma chain